MATENEKVAESQTACAVESPEVKDHRNLRIWMAKTLVGTACATAILFVIGSVTNMIRYGRAIEDGVVGTIMGPLLEVAKVMVGV